MFDRFHWWHAVLIFVAANALGALPAGWGGDDAFYHRLRKPPFSPPDWAFPAAWLFLNVTSLVALWWVANTGVEEAGGGPGGARAAFYWAEGVGWATFAAFTTLYFGLKNLDLAAADTVLGLLAAGASLWACRRLREAAGWRPFLLIAPRFGWLALASYVSVASAWLNRG